MRVGRFSAVNHVYHVTTCTRDRKPYFRDFIAARAVIHEIRYGDSAGRSETLAFVLMPDHVHWLVRISGTASLSKIVNLMKSFSARRINHLRGRRSPVWQRGFHDHGIRTGEDLAATARYIVANPLRAGLVERAGDYPHWDAIWL
ncbi:MAG: transposase [Gammaproteobacteria bacterium]|nr:transposase [Gammaproteobacteria bacterium]